MPYFFETSCNLSNIPILSEYLVKDLIYCAKKSYQKHCDCFISHSIYSWLFRINPAKNFTRKRPEFTIYFHSSNYFYYVIIWIIIIVFTILISQVKNWNQIETVFSSGNTWMFEVIWVIKISAQIANIVFKGCVREFFATFFFRSKKEHL